LRNKVVASEGLVVNFVRLLKGEKMIWRTILTAIFLYRMPYLRGVPTYVVVSIKFVTGISVVAQLPLYINQPLHIIHFIFYSKFLVPSKSHVLDMYGTSLCQYSSIIGVCNSTLSNLVCVLSLKADPMSIKCCP
jgi:hypothetical protein